MGNWETCDAVDLRVMNWKHFQADGCRYESTSWFRLDNDLPLHELWEELDGDEFKAFIGLFCFLSQKHHKTGHAPRVRFSTLERFIGKPRSVIVSMLKKISSPELNFAVIAPCGLGAETEIAPCEPGDETVLRDETEPNDTQRYDTTAGAESAPCVAAPDVAELWNANCSPLPTVKAVTPKREKKWRARWREKPDGGYWASVVQRLAGSPFCRGESEGGWKATLDFLLQPDTHVKVMEGKYDPGPAARRRTHADSVSEANRNLYLAVERGEA